MYVSEFVCIVLCPVETTGSVRKEFVYSQHQRHEGNLSYAMYVTSIDFRKRLS